MAFGMTPRHTQEMTFDNFAQGQILAIGLEAARILNWNIGHTSQSGFVAYTKFSWSSWSEEVTLNIENQKIILKSQCIGIQLFDWGKNKQNVEKFLETFKTCSETLSAEEISAKLLVAQTENREKGEQQPIDKFKNFFSVFIPTDGYYITPLLVNLNIVVFALMVISGVHFMLPDTESLVAWGANFRPVTLEGQWWRLLTSCFLHIGVIHLLMNVYALVYIGVLLEPKLGGTRFLTAYVLAGIAGSTASLFWHELTVSAGASGAIFGMYGVFLAMLTTNLTEKSARTSFLTSIVVFVGYNLLNGVRGGIDNAAHIGGLVVGIIIGYALYPSLSRPKAATLKYATMALLAVVILSAAFLVYDRTPNDIGQYDEKMKEFVSFESIALQVYQKGENASNEELLREIEDRGIHYWKESIKVIQEADKLNLPEELHAKNRKLIQYCELRIKSYELLYKAINENSARYDSEIEGYTVQIESIIKELGGGQ